VVVADLNDHVGARRQRANPSQQLVPQHDRALSSGEFATSPIVVRR
jgi:hypothetical protein